MRHLFVDAHVEEDGRDGEGEEGPASLLLPGQVALNPIRYRQQHWTHAHTEAHTE